MGERAMDGTMYRTLTRPSATLSRWERGRLIPPSRIQCIKKSRAMIASLRIAHAAVVVQRQRLLREREQHVVTRLRTAVRHAFEQAGIALRIGCRQRQQVAHAGQRANQRG